MGTDSIRLRFAPSPTGTLHTGSVRTALFNYLFAKQNGGKFILRIDDTDKERSTKEFEKDILHGLEWLGLKHDEIYYQSARGEIHKKYLQQLIAEDKVYVSKEENPEEGKRAEVIRFRNPNKKIKFEDLIKGPIEFDTTELGDFVIAKDLDTPLYHFASVVDDFELGITHVIRGEDHISNTPRQILMWEALGAAVPIVAHLPLILAPDRSKLSKRKHASIASLGEFIKRSYLPEAIINFVALLGWSPQSLHQAKVTENEEILSMDELVKNFEITKVQKSGAIFNVEKLNWINKEYIKRLPAEALTQKILEQLPKDLPGYNLEMAEKIVPIVKDRISYFGEVGEMVARGEIGYFFTQPEYDKALLKNADHLEALIEKIEKIEADFTAENIKTAIWDFATKKGRGEVLWPMRTALSGQEKSPDPFLLAEILGKDETIKRLTHAKNL